MKSSYLPLSLFSLYFALVYPFLQKNKNHLELHNSFFPPKSSGKAAPPPPLCLRLPILRVRHANICHAKVASILYANRLSCVGVKYKTQLLAPKHPSSKEEKLHHVRVAPNKMPLCQFCILSRTERFLWSLGVFRPPEPLLGLQNLFKSILYFSSSFPELINPCGFQGQFNVKGTFSR